MLYLDQAATTPVRKEALEAMWPLLSADFGNPSSHHSVGANAAASLAASRRAIATTLGARAGDVVFTSGGTEADNLAIKGLALGNPRGYHLITTPLEHAAVLESANYLKRFHGFEVDYLTPDSNGVVSAHELAEVLRPDTTLVSVHYANNEIGTVQSIAELAEVTGRVPFHSDAVQAVGSLPLSGLGVDALSLSGHKAGAPKGIGALWVRSRLPFEPVLHGGGQERGRRSGTENVPTAAAFAVSLGLAEQERQAHADSVRSLRDTFITSVLSRVPDAQLTGHPAMRLPGHASFVFASTSGEAVLLELERRGIICSSGSACAAGSDEPSHVLTAIGIKPQLAQTSVRFTFGTGICATDLEVAADAVVESVAAVLGIRKA